MVRTVSRGTLLQAVGVAIALAALLVPLLSLFGSEQAFAARKNSAPVILDNGIVSWGSVEDDTIAVGASGGVLTFFTDPDGDPLTAKLVAGPDPAAVTLTLNPDGSFVAVPAPNYADRQYFTIAACDPAKACTNATTFVQWLPVNDAPVARSTSTTIPINTSVQKDLAVDVTDVDGDPLTFSLLATFGGAQWTLSSGSTLTMDPPSNTSGTYQAVWRACDPFGACSDASWFVIASPPNTPPTISLADASCTSDTSPTATLTVSVNDVDPGTTGLTVDTIATGGTATVSGIGATRAVTFNGAKNAATGQLTIRVTDPDGASSSIVVDVRTGGSKADTLTATGATNLLFGLGGNDTLVGAAGTDILCGGAGSDGLSGGDGADFLSGGGSADVLTGGAGPDRFTGGAGIDTYADFSLVDGDSQTEAP